MNQVATGAIQKLLADPERNRLLDEYQPTELELFLFTYLQDDLTAAVPQFHRSLLRIVDGSSDVAIQAPRGMGKSVLLTKGYVAYALCTLRAKDVLICSASFPEAQRRIKILRQLFETNALMRATFGVEIGKDFGGSWSASHLELRIRGEMCNVIGRGMTSQIRGIHPDIVIIDDPEETEGAKSPLVRNTVYDVYTRSILPTRNPQDNAGKKAKIILIGTPINAEVLIYRAYENFENRFDNFDRLRFKAIEDGSNTALTGVEIGESIFPSRFPLDYLEELRRNMGPRAFAAEFLCSPMPEGTQVYFEDFFENRYDSIPPHTYSIVSVDPARTMQDAKKGSDSAIVGMSIEKQTPFEPHIYIRAAKIAHMTPRQRSKEAILMALQIEAEWIYIEDLQAGRGANAGPSDMADLMRDVAREMGVDHKVSVMTYMPVGDKFTRASRNVPPCEQGRVLFPKMLAGDIYKLYQQLILFPNAEKDDGADAFAMGLEIIQNYRKTGSKWPEKKTTISKSNYGTHRQGGWTMQKADAKWQ